LPEDYCGPILVKEVGVPTAPSEAGFTPDRQASFFTELLTQFPPARQRSFAYFSAFDAPWRAFDEIARPAPASSANPHPEEAHWGLFGRAPPTQGGGCTYSCVGKCAAVGLESANAVHAIDAVGAQSSRRGSRRILSVPIWFPGKLKC